MSDEQITKDQNPVGDDPVKNPVGLQGGSGSQGQEPVVQDVDNSGLIKKNQELLSEKKKLQVKLKEFEDLIETEKTESMKQKEQYKELWEKEQEKIKSMDTLLKQKEVKLIAKDFNDPEDALAFINKFDFDENLNITNAEDILKEIKEKKPYLFKDTTQGPLPKQTVQGVAKPYTPGKIYSRSEIANMTPEVYGKLKPELDRQESLGLIKNE